MTNELRSKLDQFLKSRNGDRSLKMHVDFKEDKSGGGLLIVHNYDTKERGTRLFNTDKELKEFLEFDSNALKIFNERK